MTNRPIPCPECIRVTAWWQKPEACPLCNGGRTIPDRRALTAAERIVERLKRWAVSNMAADADLDSRGLLRKDDWKCGRNTAIGDVETIIREEGGR